MAELAQVFVNDARVRLGGEPKPKVSKIVEAAGKNPERVEVRRLNDRNDNQGQPLELETIIDRTEESNPVYLKCIEEAKGRQTLSGQEGQPATSGVKQEQGAQTQQATPPAASAPSPPSPEPGPEPDRPRESKPKQ